MNIQHATEKRVKGKAPADAPECYGTGEIKVYLRAYTGVYRHMKMSPRHCYSCPVERRCLEQQRRMRRG